MGIDMLSVVTVSYTHLDVYKRQTQSMGTPVPGDLKYRDLNGDKVVDSKDRQVLGSYFPKINFGLNLSLIHIYPRNGQTANMC